jgi:hypothetical protein
MLSRSIGKTYGIEIVGDEPATTVANLYYE